MSDITKHNRRWYRFFAFLSFLMFFGPAAYYVSSAFLTSTLATQKVAIACSVVVVLILTGIAAVNKIILRSRLWIILIALYFVLGHAAEPIIVIGVTQVIDELMIAPTRDYFKQRYTIHREVDKR